MIPTLIEAIGTVLPAEVTSLIVVDRATGRYTVRAARGGLDEAAMIGKEITLSEGITGRAMSSRTIVLDRLDRAAYAPGVRDLVTADSMAMAAVPLIRDGALLGRDRPRPRRRARGPGFTPLECEAMSLLAAQTALALANAQFVDEVSELAVRDSLTGLYNRRHFDAALEHILRRYVRAKGARPPVAAIMFDLDHFGRFNKDHGHQAGDEVLRSLRASSSNGSGRATSSPATAARSSSRSWKARPWTKPSSSPRTSGGPLAAVRIPGFDRTRAPGDRLGRLRRPRRRRSDARGADPGRRRRPLHGQAGRAQPDRGGLTRPRAGRSRTLTRPFGGSHTRA